MNTHTLPRISIVTPSLNQGRFLNEMIGSVQGQSYPAHEHIVMDGGSTDESADLLRQFADQPRHTAFLWESKADGGQSAALNAGFARASGDIVGWLNADDRYRPECLSQVAAFFAAHPDVDVMYGDYTFMNEAGEHLELRREIEFSKFILHYHRVLYIPTTSAFFRRRIFDDGYLLNEELHYAMDLEFFIRLARAGYRFQHFPEVLADFRVHAKSKSVSGSEIHRAEHRQVVLSATPLARWIRWMWARKQMANLLQLPAAGLRYAEKLFRGYYRSGNAADGQPFSNEMQVRIEEQL